MQISESYYIMTGQMSVSVTDFNNIIPLKVGLQASSPQILLYWKNLFSAYHVFVYYHLITIAKLHVLYKFYLLGWWSTSSSLTH